jgi:sialidase-1
MKLKKIIILFFISIISTFSQQNKIPVFKSGTDGYNTFRIPAIINLLNGDLLAFCEGRLKGSADFGDINIAMKRSTSAIS